MALTAWNLVRRHEIIARPSAALILANKAARLQLRHRLVGATSAQAGVFPDGLIRPLSGAVIAARAAGYDEVCHCRVEAEGADPRPGAAVNREEPLVCAQPCLRPAGLQNCRHLLALPDASRRLRVVMPGVGTSWPASQWRTSDSCPARAIAPPFCASPSRRWSRRSVRQVSVQVFHPATVSRLTLR
jgi:hypothetical protein